MKNFLLGTGVVAATFLGAHYLFDEKPVQLLSEPVITITPSPLPTINPKTERLINAAGMAIDSNTDVDCDFFATQYEAQVFLDVSLERVGFDFFRLDRDQDGVACETLSN